MHYEIQKSVSIFKDELIEKNYEICWKFYWRSVSSNIENKTGWNDEI
jgi:hypothetical protein